MVELVAALGFFTMVTVLGIKFLQLFARGRNASNGKDRSLEFGQLLLKNKALEERIENLEMIICRLDQKINASTRRSISRSHEDIVVG